MNKRLEILLERRASRAPQGFPGRDSLITGKEPNHGESRRILHIVPSIYFAKGYEHLGSSKDIDGRQQYLWQSGAPFDTFSHLKDYLTLADDLSFFNLPDYSHIIVDLSRPGGDLDYLKKRWPKAKLIIRSHNPELSHRIDHLRAAQRVGATPLEKKSAAMNIGVFLKREIAAARRADAILHIETANTAIYWRALGFTGEIHVTPYFVSDYYLNGPPRRGQRSKRVVCVGSSHPGALITEMMANFHAAVDGLNGAQPDFSFCTTGALRGEPPTSSLSRRVGHLGLVDDLSAILSDAFAVAVTSDLGRGFKTKILDAIVCGAWVIATPGLLRRMPEALKPYCAVIDPHNPGDSLSRAIDDLRTRDWPRGDPNQTLREHAYSSLDAAIFGNPEPGRAFIAAGNYGDQLTRSAP